MTQGTAPCSAGPSTLEQANYQLQDFFPLDWQKKMKGNREQPNGYNATVFLENAGSPSGLEGKTRQWLRRKKTKNSKHANEAFALVWANCTVLEVLTKTKTKQKTKKTHQYVKHGM